MTATPVRYTDSVEKPIADEDAVHHDLIDTMRSITETTSKDYGHAVRSVHAKAHGIVAGHLVIEGGLPLELAQGLFAAPGTYKVVMRLSTNPGDILDDAVSAPRGLAKGVMGGGGTTPDFHLALMRLHADGRFPLDRLMRRYPFAEVNQAIDNSDAGTTIKPILMM